MSGHSKWHSIKHKKASADAARGKVWAKVAKVITVSARTGGDPTMNPSLRLAIEKARAVNMPKDNIDRAIKKGSGADKDGAQIEEITYEAYGPGGIALLIKCLTDNKNRSITDVKTALSRNGGSLGTAGSVAYLFEVKGLILINISEQASEHSDPDEISLLAIDAGAQDVEIAEGLLEIQTSPQKVHQIKEVLLQNNIIIESTDIVSVPHDTIDITDEEKAQKVIKLIETLENCDDVDSVSSNVNIAEELMLKFA